MEEKIKSNWIDVIIPYYNAEKYIVETLTSVENQSYGFIRVICVNNNSSDNSGKLVSDFALNSKFEYLLLDEKEPNASAARNLGLKHSKSEFICFLDSDDIINKEKIKQQIHFLKNNSEFDLVISDREIWNNDFSKLLKELSFESVVEFNIDACITNIFITGNPIYRSTVVNNINGYNSKIKVGQDWDFHIRLALNKARFGYLKGAFLKCRSHVLSLSSNWKEVSLIQEDIFFQLFDESYILALNNNSKLYIIEILFNNAIFGSPSKLNERIRKMYKIKENLLLVEGSRMSGIEFSHPTITLFYLYFKKIIIKTRK